MPRKLIKLKQVFVVIFALLAVIFIYFIYQNFNHYDEFVVVRAIETYDDDEISLSNLINFANFQYKIKPDSLCNNFDDDLLGKTHKIAQVIKSNFVLIFRCTSSRYYHRNILCGS